MTLKRLLIILFLFYLKSGYTQILINNSLDLNANAEVFDMVYISSIDQYVIVGSFTTINGQIRNKVALINPDGTLSSTTITPASPIIDGTVNSCIVIGSNLFIGGDFTSIGATPRIALARYTFTASPLLFSLNPWNPFTTSAIVDDLLLKSSSIAVVGSFTDIGGVARDNVAVFTPTGTITSAFSNIFFSHNSFASNLRLSVESTNTGYVITGKDLFANSIGPKGTMFFDVNGNYISSLGYSDALEDRTAHDFLVFSDSLYLVERDYQSFNINVNSVNPISNQTSPTLINGSSCFFNIMHQIGGIEKYNENLIRHSSGSTSSESKLSRGTVSFSGGYTENNCISIGMNGGAFNQNNTRMIKVVRNRMFMSSPTMTSVGGVPKNRFALFCLEPINPLPFTVFDTTICYGNTRTYSIPAPLFTTGYKWSYTGTGVSISSNSGTSFSPLNGSASITSTTANSVQLRFESNIAAGVLSVTPYNFCNGTADTLFAKPQSLNLNLAPPPTINLIDSLSFTCVQDSLLLITSSTFPSVTYMWHYPNLSTQISSNDSILITDTDPSSSVIYPIGYYYSTITEATNGCRAIDSVWIFENTTPPTINPTNLSTNPPVFDCSNTQMDLIASVPGSIVYWNVGLDSITQYSNPHTIFSPNPSNFTAFATSNTNGCKAQQSYSIQSDFTTILGYVTNYPESIPIPIDTINCYVSNLDLLCAIVPTDPNASNGTIAWLESGSLTDSSLIVSNLDNPISGSSKTYQFVTSNNNNGCKDTTEIVLFFDLNVPLVTNYTGVSSLNCSSDSLVLVHTETGGIVTGSWLDSANNPINNSSITIFVPGGYIYQVMDTINGCLNYDTTTVVQTNELLIQGSADSIVCPNSSFSISVSPVNNSEATTYNWSSGSSTNVAQGIGGLDTLFTVIATNTSGCVGYDTVRVEITPPIMATFQGFIGCSNGSGSLQVTSVNGGAGNYQYSIDGTNFSNSVAFDSLDFGSYTISIQDDLGCIYPFIETLDQTAGAPQIDFLVATYSGLSDTLVVVNTTTFQGFDSLVWSYPAGATVISTYDSLSFVQFADTGWYSITLIGYQDTCSYSFTKSIYVSSIKPLYPSNYENLKIQSVVVFPNPTTSQFTVEVIFGTEQNYAIVVTNELGQAVNGLSVNGFGSNANQSFTFLGSSPPGSYHIHIVSDYDARQTTLILNP